MLAEVMYGVWCDLVVETNQKKQKRQQMERVSVAQLVQHQPVQGQILQSQM